MKTGPTNEQLRSLLVQLNQAGHKEDSNLLLRLASDLGKSARNQRVVNLSKINRYTKDGETVVVPGKVLASGELSHAVTIAAWKFSQQALDKIEKSKCKALNLNDFIGSEIRGKKVRIIG